MVLITTIALLNANLVFAKDYSISAGNWRVSFESNNTFITEVDDNGYQHVWLMKDVPEKPRICSISLFKDELSQPFGKETLRGWIDIFMSPFNKTPIVSNYSIDGHDALLAEGWNATLGSIVYVALYPIDLNLYGFTQKHIVFFSISDNKTNMEILNSLHVQYEDTPLANTTPVAENPILEEPYVLIKCKENIYKNIGTYMEAGAGKVYLVTNLQIENHGYDEFNVNPNYVKVEINNVQYDYSWVTLDDLGLASLDSATLKDGGIINGAVAFEIPNSANQYSLIWKTWAGNFYNVIVEYGY